MAQDNDNTQSGMGSETGVPGRENSQVASAGNSGSQQGSSGSSTDAIGGSSGADEGHRRRRRNGRNADALRPAARSTGDSRHGRQRRHIERKRQLGPESQAAESMPVTIRPPRNGGSDMIVQPQGSGFCYVVPTGNYEGRSMGRLF